MKKKSWIKKYWYWILLVLILSASIFFLFHSLDYPTYKFINPLNNENFTEIKIFDAWIGHHSDCSKNYTVYYKTYCSMQTVCKLQYKDMNNELYPTQDWILLAYIDCNYNRGETDMLLSPTHRYIINLDCQGTDNAQLSVSQSKNLVDEVCYNR